MNMKILFSGAVTLSAFIFLISLGCSNKGIFVQIQNDSHAVMKGIVLDFTGGNQSVADLLPGKEIKTEIKPTGESSLKIKYLFNNQSYEKKIDVYFEPGYKGCIFIVLKDNSEISYKSEIEL